MNKSNLTKEKKLKKAIFKQVKKVYDLRKGKERFIAGKSRIPYAGRIYDEKELTSLVDSALDFWLTAGRFSQEFEDSFARFLGRGQCLLTNSGSSANLLAVAALTSHKLGPRRLKPGDEVITTACGFPTTLNAIIQNNLIPVFVDIDLGTYNIKVERIERAISRKTRAIFVAHTLGNPAEMDRILKLADRYQLWLIEDNCDALGAKYKGRFTGTLGHLASFSFYPPHHITMGEGGALLTDDPLLLRIAASFRDWGRDCWCKTGEDNTCGRRFSQQFGKLPHGYDHKYVYSHIGYNLKITDMQAAIGVAQLKKLEGFIKARQKNFTLLYNHLKKYRDYFILPESYKEAKPSWFGFALAVKEGAPFSRDEIVEYLEKKKIATRMLFGGNLIKQPAYQNTKYKIFGPLENTDFVMNNLFWIGVYPGLTNSMLKFIFRTFDEFLKK